MSPSSGGDMVTVIMLCDNTGWTTEYTVKHCVPCVTTNHHSTKTHISEISDVIEQTASEIWLDRPKAQTASERPKIQCIDWYKCTLNLAEKKTQLASEKRRTIKNSALIDTNAL